MYVSKFMSCIRKKMSIQKINLLHENLKTSNTNEIDGNEMTCRIIRSKKFKVEGGERPNRDKFQTVLHL